MFLDLFNGPEVWNSVESLIHLTMGAACLMSVKVGLLPFCVMNLCSIVICICDRLAGPCLIAYIMLC